jgi:hypothetical protein
VHAEEVGRVEQNEEPIKHRVCYYITDHGDLGGALSVAVAAAHIDHSKKRDLNENNQGHG